MNAYLVLLHLYPLLARLEWLRSRQARTHLQHARMFGYVNGWQLTPDGEERLVDMGVIAF